MKERLLRRIIVDEATGCWLWQGRLNRGYGNLHVGGPGPDQQRWRVHRLAYTLFVGPIPDGLEIDHLCRVRNCCNPLHLEPVTTKENLNRSPEVAWAKKRSATHCAEGHPYTLRNDGYRQCPECNRRRTREYRARKKAEAA